MVGIVEHLVQRDTGLLRPGDGTGYGGMPEPVGMPEPEGLGDTVQRAAREAAGLALARPVEIHEQGTGLGAPSGNPFAQGVEGRGGEGLHPALSPPALQCHEHGSRVEVEVFEVEGYNGPTAQGEVEQAVGVAAFGQFDPHQEAAAGPGCARARGKGVVDQAAQALGLGGIGAAQAAHVLGVAAALEEAADRFAQQRRLRHRGTELEFGQFAAEAAAFHGHVCPGLALGYRAAETALERLRSGRAEDEELVTIAETDACGVDAIQVLTGCTAGKGNLFFKDYGKHAFTFINRRTGDAVRVAANPSFNIDSLDPGLAPLRARVMQGRASDKEHAEFHERTGRIVEALLHMPAEELFSIQNVDVEIPERARIFRSVPCS